MALAGLLLLAACETEKRFTSGEPVLAPYGWIECVMARQAGVEGTEPCAQTKP